MSTFYHNGAFHFVGFSLDDLPTRRRAPPQSFRHSSSHLPVTRLLPSHFLNKPQVKSPHKNRRGQSRSSPETLSASVLMREVKSQSVSPTNPLSPTSPMEPSPFPSQTSERSFTTLPVASTPLPTFFSLPMRKIDSSSYNHQYNHAYSMHPSSQYFTDPNAPQDLSSDDVSYQMASQLVISDTPLHPSSNFEPAITTAAGTSSPFAQQALPTVPQWMNAPNYKDHSHYHNYSSLHPESSLLLPSHPSEVGMFPPPASETHVDHYQTDLPYQTLEFAGGEVYSLGGHADIPQF